MNAIIQINNKQYHVSIGDTINFNFHLSNIGNEIICNKVLYLYNSDFLSSIHIGSPFIKSSLVKMQIINHGLDKKICIFKKKRRKNYRRKHGYRSAYTSAKITDILY